MRHFVSNFGTRNAGIARQLSLWSWSYMLKDFNFDWCEKPFDTFFSWKSIPVWPLDIMNTAIGHVVSNFGHRYAGIARQLLLSCRNHELKDFIFDWLEQPFNPMNLWNSIQLQRFPLIVTLNNWCKVCWRGSTTASWCISERERRGRGGVELYELSTSERIDVQTWY